MPLTDPVTTPVDELGGLPVVVLNVGVLFAGTTVTVMVCCTTPRRPSLTVKVNVSVRSAVDAVSAAALCLAAAVGV